MRRFYLKCAWLVLGCLLITQATLAAVPCLSPKATAASAVATMPQTCHKSTPGALCLAQCVQGDQTVCKLPSVAPDMPALLLLPTLAPVDDVALWRAERFERLADIPRGPPPPIRFCSLLL
jgi:hypothetical protein